MKVSTEIDNNFGYEKITQLVENIPLTLHLRYVFSALDPLGTLCGPQRPRLLTLPLTTNPRSAPDHPSKYLSINLKKINLNLVYFVVWLSYKKRGVLIRKGNQNKYFPPKQLAGIRTKTSFVMLML